MWMTAHGTTSISAKYPSTTERSTPDSTDAPTDAPTPDTTDTSNPHKHSSKRRKHSKKPKEKIEPGKTNIPRLHVQDFLEILCCLHLSSYVPSPIEDAGGFMLIAPSGSMKSSLLAIVNNLYPARCVIDSNWYYSKLLKMAPAFYNRSIRSIIIPELSSIYAGDPRTGARIEAMLQQMAGEGCFSTNEDDSRFQKYEMRATVFGAMTPEFWSRKNKDTRWQEGFHRRFIWGFLAPEDDDVLMDYLQAWRRAEIELSQPPQEPAQQFIPDTLTYEEKGILRKILKPQSNFGPSHARFVVFCKAIAVLKWHYKRMKINKNAIETAKRFSLCLGDKAALLIIPKIQRKK
jgi:hypothetical protein